MDPYFMHPSDNPGIAIVSPPLTNLNYHSWSRSIVVALRSKNKIGFLDGTLLRPDESNPLTLAWDRCNTMVMAWITNSVEPDIAQSILWMDTASEIWTELRDRYHQGDIFRISDIQEQLFNLKQGDLTITQFFTNLKKLWQELDNFRPVPTCTCAIKCSCTLLPTIKSYRETDYVIRFLKGLNEQYAPVRSQIMLLNPLPPINKVFSMLIQQERQMIAPIEEDKLLANFAKTQHRSSSTDNNPRNSAVGRGKSLKMCTFCNKSGHTVEVCFKKHGLPPYLKKPQVNNASAYTENPNNNEDLESEAHTTQPTFTADQHKALLALLQQSQNSVPTQIQQFHSSINTNSGILPTPPSPIFTDCWILDTGATDHVCHCRSLFHTLYNMNMITVKLPNGHTISTNKCGTIHLNHNLHLTNVLYIPEFFTNIISIPRITAALNCNVQFTSTHCTIQVNHTQKTIGTADLHQGLYYLRLHHHLAPHNPAISFPVNNRQINTCNLWHHRLGHPSNDTATQINKLYPLRDFQYHTIPCDSCFAAKQKRLPFPHSSTNSIACFDIIHMDIWGPYSTPSMFGYRYFLTIVDDHSRFCWIFLMKLKSETSNYVKAFVKLIQTQFKTTIKTIRSDNGPEFILKDFYQKQGIIHQTSCIDTPQQNGIVERKHQHLLCVTRSILFQAHLPKMFWAHALEHATFLINRLPSKFLKHKSPFSVLYNQIPNYNNLKVFGCLVYAAISKNKTTKLDTRSKKCLFLGHKTHTKGDILFDLTSKQIFVSRDTTFFEHIFPYAHTTTHTQQCPYHTTFQ